MSDTAQIMLRAYKAHVALPAFNIPYLPMMEPVTKAIADEDSFALIEVARLEFIKFEAVSQAAIKAEFDKWQNPGHMRLHQDHVPVIDEDGLHIDFPADLQSAIDLGFGSVMVDGSRLSLDANIAATRQVRRDRPPRRRAVRGRTGRGDGPRGRSDAALRGALRQRQGLHRCGGSQAFRAGERAATGSPSRAATSTAPSPQG